MLILEFLGRNKIDRGSRMQSRHEMQQVPWVDGIATPPCDLQENQAGGWQKSHIKEATKSQGFKVGENHRGDSL